MLSVADRTNFKLTGWEKFWYYLSCILTLGHLYFVKVLIKKAMLEVFDAQQYYADQVRLQTLAQQK